MIPHFYSGGMGMDILEEKKSNHYFKKDEQVIHKKFGKGIIYSVDEKIIQVDFNEGRKKMCLEVLIKNNLLEKA
jgi:hypothetical protein